jgi:hypothetical protein
MFRMQAVIAVADARALGTGSDPAQRGCYGTLHECSLPGVLQVRDRSKPRRLQPLLSDEIARDREMLRDAIDALLRDDRILRGLHRRILRRQKGLRALTTDKAWKLYLALERAEIERWERSNVLVARWAWRHGLRGRGR